MKKSKQPELKTVDELEEEVPVERLKVNKHGAEVDEALPVDDIDSLLREERLIDDDALDLLFTDEKKNRFDDVEVEVRKALYQSKTSKAQLFRADKSAEVTKTTRSEEISQYKSLEDEWDGTIVEDEANAVKPMVYVAIGLLVIIIAAGAWALWNVSQHDQVAHKDAHDQRKQDAEELAEKKAAAAREIQKIESSLKQFAELEKPEEKLKFLHDSENLKEQMIAFYQQPENVKPYVNLDIDRVVEERVNKRKVWTAIASYGHREARKHEFFFFHKEANGDYTLDWKALAGVQEADWKKFVNEQSTKPIEIRAIVQPKIQDGHYNWGFNDDDYSAYRLILNDDQVFWGYVRNDNIDLVTKMNKTVITMRAYQKIYRMLNLEMILKIKFLENTHELNKQCVEITEVVSPHWLDLRDKVEAAAATENP